MFEFQAGLSSVFVIAFLLGLLVIAIYASAAGTVLVGAAVLGVVLLALYYLIVRFDRWARGESSSAGTSRRGGES